MPNMLAFAALSLWPVMALILFRRLPAGRAVIANLFVAYLLLPPPPAGLDLPMLPPFTKETIPSLVAFVICLFMYKDRMTLFPQSATARVLMVIFVVSPVITVLTNGDTIYVGQFSQQAMQAREAVGLIVQQSILILPFILGLNFLREGSDMRDLSLALFFAGIAYSLPMLVEVQFSPMMNIWVYGFFQHDWTQMIRDGGFRPIVFLYHGLWVAFLTMMATVAAVALMRAEQGRRTVWFAACAGYLVVMLILCKSTGSMLFALFLVPIVLLASQRAQLRVAFILGALAISYPAAKVLHIVPEQQIIALAENAGTERAESLAFRIDNENLLLDRAMERPLFGWGSWGRNQLIDESSGQVVTVVDGRWILLIGSLGLLGFLAEFGLLLLPIAVLYFKDREGYEEPVPYIAPLCLLVAINVVDLIPNATITPLTWLFAGAILGYAESHVPKLVRTPPSFRTVM
jgi:hypothetical protein